MTLFQSPHRLFADTSFYYATLDQRDPTHPAAKQYTEWLAEHRCELISTWEIIVETITLLRTRHSYAASITFLHTVLPTLQIFYIQESDRAESFKLFEKFSSDKKISLCDAISYHVITKHLKNIPHLAFDDDFLSLGLTPFKIF